MKITFYEVFGDAEAEGVLTVVAEHEGALSVGDDTFLNASSHEPQCRIGGQDFTIKPHVGGSVWTGQINPNLGSDTQRGIRFAQLHRADGKADRKFIVVMHGHVQRGEAIMNITPCATVSRVKNETIVCFTQGARILTSYGEVPVENLRVGDLVHTKDNGLLPILWIGRREITKLRMTLAPHLQPVRIAANAFGPAIPSADIWVSPQHNVLVDAPKPDNIFVTEPVLAPAKGLANGDSIRVDPILRDTAYIHLLFEEHQIIYADGLPSETFYPCPNSLMSLDARDRAEVFDLIPRLQSNPLNYGTPARRVLQGDEAQFNAPIRVAYG